MTEACRLNLGLKATALVTSNVDIFSKDMNIDLFFKSVARGSVKYFSCLVDDPRVHCDIHYPLYAVTAYPLDMLYFNMESVHPELHSWEYVCSGFNVNSLSFMYAIDELRLKNYPFIIIDPCSGRVRACGYTDSQFWFSSIVRGVVAAEDRQVETYTPVLEY